MLVDATAFHVVSFTSWSNSARSPVSDPVANLRRYSSWRGNPRPDRRLEQCVGRSRRTQLGQTQVVRAALEQREREAQVAVFLQRGQVFARQLALQRDRRSRDDHLEPGRDGGDEIGKALTGTGRRFGQQVMAAVERVGDRAGQLVLTFAPLPAHAGHGRVEERMRVGPPLHSLLRTRAHPPTVGAESAGTGYAGATWSRASYSSASASSAFAQSPLYDEPCMIASVRGSSSAKRRIVGAVLRRQAGRAEHVLGAGRGVENVAVGEGGYRRRPG